MYRERRRPTQVNQQSTEDTSWGGAENNPHPRPSISIRKQIQERDAKIIAEYGSLTNYTAQLRNERYLTDGESY